LRLHALMLWNALPYMIPVVLLGVLRKHCKAALRQVPSKASKLAVRDI